MPPLALHVLTTLNGAQVPTPFNLLGLNARIFIEKYHTHKYERRHTTRREELEDTAALSLNKQKKFGEPGESHRRLVRMLPRHLTGHSLCPTRAASILLLNKACVKTGNRTPVKKGCCGWLTLGSCGIVYTAGPTDNIVILRSISPATAFAMCQTISRRRCRQTQPPRPQVHAARWRTSFFDSLRECCSASPYIIAAEREKRR